MSNTHLIQFLPTFLVRHLLTVETKINTAVKSFGGSLTSGAYVLDAGCGESAYRSQFCNHRYIGVDTAVGDQNWDYSHIDAQADLAVLPFRVASFDAVLSIVVLEHTSNPEKVLCEVARVLKPGGRLLLIVPLQWEVHQAPHDYFRFTCFGLEHLLAKTGFSKPLIEPLGGFFTLAGRRCLNAATFFKRGFGWILFPPVLIIASVCALILPLFDRFDHEKRFTLGYVCQVKKP